MFSLVYESTKHLILEFCSCRFRALQCWLKGFKTLTCMLLVPMIVACACCICHARLLQLRCASYNQPSIATSGVPCTVQSDGARIRTFVWPIGLRVGAPPFPDIPPLIVLYTSISVYFPTI